MTPDPDPDKVTCETKNHISTFSHNHIPYTKEWKIKKNLPTYHIENGNWNFCETIRFSECDV
jgi:hypothetical protein